MNLDQNNILDSKIEFCINKENELNIPDLSNLDNESNDSFRLLDLQKASDINLLISIDIKYKKILDNYFKNNNNKYILENNKLIVDLNDVKMENIIIDKDIDIEFTNKINLIKKSKSFNNIEKLIVINEIISPFDAYVSGKSINQLEIKKSMSLNNLEELTIFKQISVACEVFNEQKTKEDSHLEYTMEDPKQAFQESSEDILSDSNYQIENKVNYIDSEDDKISKSVETTFDQIFIRSDEIDSNNLIESYGVFPKVQLPVDTHQQIQELSEQVLLESEDSNNNIVKNERETNKSLYLENQDSSDQTEQINSLNQDLSDQENKDLLNQDLLNQENQDPLHQTEKNDSVILDESSDKLTVLESSQLSEFEINEINEIRKLLKIDNIDYYQQYDIISLNSEYQKLINFYFPYNSIGKYIILKNKLIIKINNLIEKFYIENNVNNSVLEWKNIDTLEEKYKKLCNSYFTNNTGKYILKNNQLIINYDNWGLEKFYINDSINEKINHKNFYTVKYKNITKKNDIAVCVQIGNWDKFLTMENYLSNFLNLNCTFHFTMVLDVYNYQKLKYLSSKYVNSVIIYGYNKGMDIGLFLITLHHINLNNIKYKSIFKIHTKTDDTFRNYTLSNFMGSEDIILNNINKLNSTGNGMLGVNNIYSYKNQFFYYEQNMYHIKKYIKFLYNEDPELDKLEFVEGTMFLFKQHIFDILNNYNIEYIYNKLNDDCSLDINWYCIYYNIDINDIELIKKTYYNNLHLYHGNNLHLQKNTKKSGLRDFMKEHAFERLFGYICKKNNLNIIN